MVVNLPLANDAGQASFLRLSLCLSFFNVCSLEMGWDDASLAWEGGGVFLLIFYLFAQVTLDTTTSYDKFD